MDFPAVYSHSTLLQNISLPPFQEGQEIFLSREHMFPEILGPWEQWGEVGSSCSQATDRNVFWWPMWSVWAVADGTLICACLLSHFSHVQLFATPWVDCSPPDSSVHGDSPNKNTGVGCCALLQKIFQTQGSKPSLTSPSLACGLFTSSSTCKAQWRTHAQSKWKTSKAVPPDMWCYLPIWMASHSHKSSLHARQHIKKERHYFANKSPSSHSYNFPSSHVWMWKLDCKESWALKNWCFSTVGLEKTLESPLDCKEIQPVHTKGNQSWIFIGRTDAEAETPLLWPSDVKNWLLGKDPDTGKDWRQEEKGTTEWDVWMASPTWWAWV